MPNVIGIRIKNIMGIEEFEILPGKITKISGHNAAGKTSIMEAILSVVNGGHSASLLRNGAEEGEIVILLDDETKISKHISPDESEMNVSIGKQKVKAPATYVKNLFGTGFNPVAFLNMPEATRISEILKAMPLSISSDQIKEVCGINVTNLDTTKHGLNVIDDAYNRIFDVRTKVNAEIKERELTLESLDSFNVHKDRTLDIEKLKEKRSILEEENRNNLEDKARMIRELSDQKNAEIQAVHDKYAVLFDQLSANIEDKSKSIITQLSEVGTELATAEQEQRNYDNAIAGKERFNQLSQDQKKAKEAASTYTDALAKLKQFKAEIASNYSIDGYKISIVDGKLYVDDVPYERINRAAQIKIAISLATNKIGDAKFVCVDGMEALDAESISEIYRIVEEKGIQLVFFEVSDGALSSEVLA